MLSSFNRRAFVSLIVFIFFGVILITSVMMFINPHTTRIALTHTLVGFSLLMMVVWHLFHNFASFKHYWKPRSRSAAKANWALRIALPLAALFVALVLIPARPFQSFYEWGNRLRAASTTAESLQFNYVRVDQTAANAQGNKLVIDLRKGPYFHWPQYAIWLETLDGTFIQPLYVTQKLAQNQFANKVTQRNQGQVFTSDLSASDDQTWETTFASEWSPQTAGERKRPESLPVFLHQLARQNHANVFVPADKPTDATAKNQGIDGFSGATLLDNFLLSARAQQTLPPQYRVRLEINQSFDFNEFYSSDRFPDDPIYSGDGYSAQPSVIYEAIIDTLSKQRYYPMTLIGHGHHSGANGDVDYDLHNLTTAKALVDRVIVELENKE